MGYKILSINPGSTSTKVALYEDENKIFSQAIDHPSQDLDRFKEIPDQLEYRMKRICRLLTENKVKLRRLAAVVGRGGLLPHMQSGGYLVNQAMKDAILSGKASPHASNLGALLAGSIASEIGVPAYIYDCVTSDEMQALASVTGMADVRRESMCHVLNMKAMARKTAKKYGRNYEELRLIVAHLGGGISLSAHENGKIIDCIRDDDGPFSPERSGSIPLLPMIDLCYSGELSREDMIRRVRGLGGIKAHLGTSDCRQVEQMIAMGDEKAKLIYEAQAYQIAKAIGEMAPVLGGKIDFIILTGGMAYSKMMTNMVTSRVEFIAPLEILPGEDEMEALTLGTLRILRGEETAGEYKTVEV